MNKARIEKLEKQVRDNKTDDPPPGFYKTGDPMIDCYREELLRAGYTLEQVNRTPLFIEE